MTRSDPGAAAADEVAFAVLCGADAQAAVPAALGRLLGLDNLDAAGWLVERTGVADTVALVADRHHGLLPRVCWLVVHSGWMSPVVLDRLLADHAVSPSARHRLVGWA